MGERREGNKIWCGRPERLSLVEAIASGLLVTSVFLACGTSTSSGETEMTDSASTTFLPAVPRIVAIGDVHGDLDATRRALRLAGAIDDADHWIGGDLVVVQTGDQLDRGEGEQDILDLLHRLAGTAEEAGGALHVLNGNHEIMNAALDMRYVTDGGFLDFEDAVEVDEADSLLLEYDENERARVQAFRPGGPYALLLAERNVILQVGENVFVHGGVLPQHLEYGLERINAETQEWLRGDRSRPEVMRGKDSPIWTRRFSDEVESDDCETLSAVLESLHATRMVVGHTVQDEGMRSYCDGKVWCIDVGMASAYGGDIEVLSIVGDEIEVLREP